MYYSAERSILQNLLILSPPKSNSRELAHFLAGEILYRVPSPPQFMIERCGAGVSYSLLGNSADYKGK